MMAGENLECAAPPGTEQTQVRAVLTVLVPCSMFPAVVLAVVDLMI